MRGLFAPWVLHCGLNPESTYSAAMLRVIGFAIELAGCPIVKGGADNLVKAFAQLITDQGGTIRTGADVETIVEDHNGQAAGVRLASGEVLQASKGVIASVTPGQLYGRLLKNSGKPLPSAVADGLQTYRYGKGNMQVHYALKSPPRWKGGEELSKVALLHLTPGLNGVSRAANECDRGMLPAVPTICVGQPTALDPPAHLKVRRSSGCNCPKPRDTSKAMPQENSPRPAMGAGLTNCANNMPTVSSVSSPST